MKRKIIFLFIVGLVLVITGCGKKSNIVSGDYKCRSYYDEDGEIILKFNLNGDKTFKYEGGNAVVEGKYTYKVLDKEVDGYKYYGIYLTPTSMIIDGEKQDYSDTVQTEFAMKKDGRKKEGLLIFATSYSMYYCKNY